MCSSCSIFRGEAQEVLTFSWPAHDLQLVFALHTLMAHVSCLLWSRWLVHACHDAGNILSLQKICYVMVIWALKLDQLILAAARGRSNDEILKLGLEVLTKVLLIQRVESFTCSCIDTHRVQSITSLTSHAVDIWLRCSHWTLPRLGFEPRTFRGACHIFNTPLMADESGLTWQVVSHKRVDFVSFTYVDANKSGLTWQVVS